jgi:hypothetical protein
MKHKLINIKGRLEGSKSRQKGMVHGVHGLGATTFNIEGL